MSLFYSNFIQATSLILFCRIIANFIEALYQLYAELYFTYLEINPLVVTKDTIYILDLAAKLDSTADFVCRPKWGEINYPPPFGRDAFPEEAYIADLDAKSGASLKVSEHYIALFFN
jgi:ATP citrate (pro-S)-lyase